MDRVGAAFCTVIAKNYLAYARTLGACLERHHHGVPFHVLVIDDIVGYVEPEQEGFQCMTLDELELPRPREFCFRYDVLELATAVKPFLLRHLFQKGHDKLVYLDPDVYLYRPLDELLCLLESFDALLTPHRTEGLRDQKRPSELDILLCGAYNLGFLALARRPGVDRFLAWWSDRCERECVVDPARAHFVDQRWMDLCPSLLDRVCVLRHPGYNVAYWNLDHRRLAGSPDAPTVNGEPLYFFHFSGLEPHKPLTLSRHQDRYPRIAEQPLLSMVQRYSAQVLAAGHSTQRVWAYTHATFSDGHPIGREMRELFRDQAPGRFPDPFDVRGEDSFVRWATTPATGTGVAPLVSRLQGAWRRAVGSDSPGPLARLRARMSRIALRLLPLRAAARGPCASALPPVAERILEHRPDVRQACTLPGGAFDRTSFLRWLAGDGVVHHHLKRAWCTRWLSELEGSEVMPHLLAAYGSRPQLQRQFPMAFVEEHDAPRFRAWVEAHALELRIDAAQLARVRRLFEDEPAVRIRELLAQRPDVQQAFPEALGWPGDPRFLTWLRDSGRREYGISEDWVLWFERARQQHLCTRLHQLHASRPEWRREHPAAFLLGGRSFLAWLKQSGSGDLGFDVGSLDRLCPPGLRALTPLQELRLLRSTDLPAPGLPSQRRAGDARALGTWAIAHASEYGLDPVWIERLEQELSSLGPDGEGATIVGYLRTESGVGELARATARALAAVDYPYGTLALDEAPQRQADFSLPHQQGPVDPPFAIVHANAPEALRFKNAAALGRGEYRIGYWAWELDELPVDWPEAFSLFDELWTCSRHAASAIASVAPIPVQVMWPCIPEASPRVLGREELGLDPDAFLFLFLYDLLSETERKNPLGLIRAFRAAFRGDEPVGLVIKVANRDQRPGDFDRVLSAAGDVRVTILDCYLSRAEVSSLIQASDAYVSLHRAEGFGLTLAEAMAMGKPTLATYYSGNVDFMTPWNSFPIAYRLVEIPGDHGPYRRGGVWAEPDLDDAARAMRHVYHDRGEVRAIAQRGRDDVRRMLSPLACGRRVAERLRAIARSGSPRRQPRGRS